jgi:hypothetical protein
MSTEEIYSKRPWTSEETNQLPYSYEPNKILIADSDPDTTIYCITPFGTTTLFLPYILPDLGPSLTKEKKMKKSPWYTGNKLTQESLTSTLPIGTP